MFHEVLNWKLLRGSHNFPGSNGGTCIMEAAILAAGHRYRPVMGSSCSADELPASFSPTISGFALMLNDFFEDDDRQGLLRFVALFDGTGGGDEEHLLGLLQMRLGELVARLGIRVDPEYPFSSTRMVFGVPIPTSFMAIILSRKAGMYLMDPITRKKANPGAPFLVQILEELIDTARACTGTDVPRTEEAVERLRQAASDEVLSRKRTEVADLVDYPPMIFPDGYLKKNTFHFVPIDFGVKPGVIWSNIAFPVKGNPELNMYKKEEATEEA